VTSPALPAPAETVSTEEEEEEGSEYGGGPDAEGGPLYVDETEATVVLIEHFFLSHAVIVDDPLKIAEPVLVGVVAAATHGGDDGAKRGDRRGAGGFDVGDDEVGGWKIAADGESEEKGMGRRYFLEHRNSLPSSYFTEYDRPSQHHSRQIPSACLHILDHDTVRRIKRRQLARFHITIVSLAVKSIISLGCCFLKVNWDVSRCSMRH